MAVAKPAGLLVHPTRLDPRACDSLLRQLSREFGQYLYPLHRLDRATSGLVLFGRSAAIASAVGAAFAAGEVAKRYLAIVRGWPPPALTIDHPLSRPAAPPRAALTELTRLATVELEVRVDRYPTSRYALVELAPLSGRRHQLRRHLKHVDHPIIGDTSYGQGRHNRLFRERYPCPRLLLAAVELRLAHPLSGAPLTLTAPLSADFAAIVAALGFTAAVPAAWRRPPADDACD